MRWDRTRGRPEPVAALDRIPLVECGEPLVDLRIEAPAVRIGYDRTIPYCRATVAHMVQRAAESLPPGVFLAVTDAWRPFQRQMLIYEFMMRSAREAFPQRSETQLIRTVNRWVAPPNRKAPPGHCTGAALDVILQNEAGEPLDVTSPFDRMGGGPTFMFGLTPEAQAHRFLLYDAMMGAGFSNCRDEWWHYSYGDAGWAVRLGFDHAIYGRIELPEELYREQQLRWEEMHLERPNPFLTM